MNNAYKQLLSGMDSIAEKLGSNTAKATLNQLEAMIQTDPEGFARSFFRAAFVERPKLRSWYRDNVEMLRGAACDQYPAISTYDLDATLGSLHANLSQYDGPTSKRAFLKWATEQVKRQAARLEAFHRLQSEHSKVAHAGIWKVLRGSTDLGYDPKLTVPEIMSGVWLKVYKELDSLLEQGHRAKPGTRICAIAKWQARAWKQDQLRLRGVDDSRSKLRQESQTTFTERAPQPAKRREPETYDGVDLQTGEPRTYSKWEVDRMTGDQMKKCLRLTPSKLALPNHAAF